MLSYEKQRQLIVVFILAFILVIIGAVMALVLIWKEKPVEEKKFEVGAVEGIRVDEEDVMKKYYNDIVEKLQNSDVESLVDMVSPDYLEYKNLTKDDIRKFLNESNMYGKSISLANAVEYNIPEYNHVYQLDLTADGEVYSLNIILRETSPEQYTISFDKFIDYKQDVYTGNVESVALNIMKRARFTTSVTYRLRVMNNYHDTIVINSQRSSDPVPYVSSSTQASKQAMASSILNMELVMPEGQAREFEVTYSMVKGADYYNYNVLVLRDVKYNGIDGMRDLEFRLR